MSAVDTQMAAACRGEITEVMRAAAETEGVSAEQVRTDLAQGHAVIPANPSHLGLRPAIVGRVYRTKVNANIGRSTERSSFDEEMSKLRAALEAGADFVMDLSVGPELGRLRQAMVKACPVALGTVPIYEALSRVEGRVEALNADLLLQVVREQAEQGVDFMTLHAGLLKRHVPLAAKRVMGIVSRGGAVLAEWMLQRDAENPLYEHWPRFLDICARHDVTVSLGDGLRPGCLADASDEAQFAELDVLGDLVRQCRKQGVQVMVEGPGHLPFDQIQKNMERQRNVCDGAPFYVLGPIVTDIAAGYDHIASSIGAAAAAYHGAALLCYVTPAEHLALPTEAEVREGVVAHRIAAHAADVARGLPGSRARDDAMAQARMNFDWSRQFNLALDPERAERRYMEGRAATPGDLDHCSMCGREFCAIRATRRIRDAVRPGAPPRSEKGG